MSITVFSNVSHSSCWSNYMFLPLLHMCISETLMLVCWSFFRGPLFIGSDHCRPRTSCKRFSIGVSMTQLSSHHSLAIVKILKILMLAYFFFPAKTSCAWIVRHIPLKAQSFQRKMLSKLFVFMCVCINVSRSNFSNPRWDLGRKLCALRADSQWPRLPTFFAFLKRNKNASRAFPINFNGPWYHLCILV